MQICLLDLKNVINPPWQVLLNNWKDNDISVKPKGENLNQKKKKKKEVATVVLSAVAKMLPHICLDKSC